MESRIWVQLRKGNHSYLLIVISIWLLLFVSCVRTDQPAASAPCLIDFDQIHARGELFQRAMRNFDRLETDIFFPDSVFPKKHHGPSEGWPGDKEGRTILGLVLDAQATHRTPKYLEEMIRILPEKLNQKGYLGPLQQDTIDEQQLSGHGWLLRALCEYYQWKKDPKVKTYIQRIIENLALPTKGRHKAYPITAAGRISNTGGMAGSSVNVVNHWKLSTDVGCDFVFMDGLIQTYGLFPSTELKGLIDEMMSRFLEMDLVGIKAQTHATLTGLRAALRYYQLTGQKILLPEVEKRYRIYHKQAMTENYENYNWFDRPEWTEPCAIVDSYLLGVQLWQNTQDPKYLEDAQLIYYNAISHTQRSNGGFGCDNCAGAYENSLFVKANEAYWCCTMRGGEGLAKAVQYSYFTQGDTLIIPSFNSSSVNFNLKGNPVTIGQQTSYPFGTNVVLTFEKLDKPVLANLKFFVPSWIQDPKVLKNHEIISFKVINGFAESSVLIKVGDTIEYSFSMKSGVEPVVNQLHTNPGYFRLFYGPLLLGYEGPADIEISKQAEIAKTEENGFQIKGSDIFLSTVYHLMDPRVSQSSGYRKQILFRQKAN